MKKTGLVFTLLAISLVSFTACGNNGENVSEVTSNSTATSAQISTESMTQIATTKKETQNTKSKTTKSQLTSKVTPSSTTTSTKSETIKSQSTKEEYYCMGKNDTCNNKTSDPYDLYCYSCDPDGNNIEGDQSKNKSDGIVEDNNYDGYVDEDDWEDEWENYLNDKFKEYGY